MALSRPVRAATSVMESRGVSAPKHSITRNPLASEAMKSVGVFAMRTCVYAI